MGTVDTRRAAKGLGWHMLTEKEANTFRNSPEYLTLQAIKSAKRTASQWERRGGNQETVVTGLLHQPPAKVEREYVRTSVNLKKARRAKAVPVFDRMSTEKRDIRHAARQKVSRKGTPLLVVK